MVKASRGRTTGSRFDPWTIVAGLVGLAAVAVLLAVFVKSSGDDAAATPQTSAVAAPTSTLFAPDDHTNLPTAAGCDQLYFHSAMAMWNPSLADELLAFDCPFPFEPETISMEGGAEDLSLAAPFEPRRYQEIFDIITAQKIGTCAVGRIEEPSERGFVYGFLIKLKANTCAANDPNIEVSAREFATRAHRDEAANAMSVATTFVLGRWVVTLDGTDAEAMQRLSTDLLAIGAAQVAT